MPDLTNPRILLAAVALWAMTAVCGCKGHQAPEAPATQQAAGTSGSPAPAPARVKVTVALPGASAEQIERDVTVKIEAAVMKLANLGEVRSISREGVSQVYVEFAPGIAADEAIAAVRAGVNTLTADALPADAEDPIVALTDTGPLAASIVVYGDISDHSLHKLADELRGLIAWVAGVGRAELIAKAYEIAITVSPENLRKYGLTVTDINRALGSRPIPGGEPVAAATRPDDQGVTDWGHVVVAKAGGKAIRLADVAEISEDESCGTTVRVGGKPGALVHVYARQGQDPSAVTRGIRAAVARYKSRMPESVRVDVHDFSPAGREVAPLIRVAVDCAHIPAREIEPYVTYRLGAILVDIEGATSIITVSSPGRSVAQVSFDRGTDLPTALSRVSGRMKEGRNQIRGVAAATIEPVPSVPIGRIDVRGGASADDRLKTAARLRRELVSIPGIARVEAPSLGPSKPVFEMVLNRRRIAALGLTDKGVVNYLRQALSLGRGAVIQSPSGRVRVVMSRSRTRDLDEVRNLRMFARDRHVPMTELVEFRIGAQQSAAQRVDGRSCVTLEIFGDGVRQTEAIIEAIRKLAARAGETGGDPVAVDFHPAAGGKSAASD